MGRDVGLRPEAVGTGQVNLRTAGDGKVARRRPGWVFLGASGAVFFPGIRASFCSETPARTLALSASTASRFGSLSGGTVAGRLWMRLAYGSQDIPLENLDYI